MCRDVGCGTFALLTLKDGGRLHGTASCCVIRRPCTSKVHKHRCSKPHHPQLLMIVGHQHVYPNCAHCTKQMLKMSPHHLGADPFLHHTIYLRKAHCS